MDAPPSHPVISWLTVGIITAGATFGSQLTLFPAYFGVIAEERGFSPAIVGFAYMFMFLISFVVSLVGDKIVARLGRKGTIISGVFLHAPVCILLACIPLMNDGGFIVCAFIARIFQGTGQAFVHCGEFALMGAVYPKRISTMVAIY